MERLLSGKNNNYPPATLGTVAARGIGFPDEAHGVDETAVPEEFLKILSIESSLQDPAGNGRGNRILVYLTHSNRFF